MPDAPATPAPTVRQRMADARATVVGTKGLRSRVAKHTAALTALRARVDAHQERLGRHDQRLKDLETRLKELDRATVLDTTERERRDTQLGTVEARLADLEQRLDDAAFDDTTTPPDAERLAAGRDLLDEVRTEHARIRVRLQVVSGYEERLRRVEESVTQLFDGDLRHLV